ncbi:MAG: TlpA family protein disulfide reductase [Spirochaetaceae bacterium]|nr:MAG: TlpA family protein disulfide reductase [Spirochaetaceae bacterium]
MQHAPRRSPLALPVALALLILALPLYGGGRPQTSSARDGASAHDEALLSIGVRPVDAAVPGADVEFALLAGEPAHATFGSYAGRLVLVNYWATWCEPCRLEMPSMQRLHENFADRGVVVLAMNYGESAEQARQYIEAEGYTFPVGLDPNREMANRFGVRGLPTNYLIGANGRIIGTKVGFRFWDTPEVFRAVEQLLESQ